MIRGNEKQLPKQGVVGNKLVSNYHLLPKEILLSEGWIDEEYQPTTEEVRQQLISQVNTTLDNLSSQGMQSSCLGDTRTFTTDEKSVTRINGLVTIAQQNLINQILGVKVERSRTPWKDASTELCFDFTDAQIIQLGGEIGNAMIELEHTREELLQALNNAETVEEMMSIVSTIN